MKLKVYIIVFLMALIVGCNQNSEFDIFKPNFEVYVLLPDGGLGDRSFADIIYEGVETSKNDFDFSINYIIPDDIAEGEEWIENIPQLSTENNEPVLIIIAGTQYQNATNNSNGQFGQHKVLLLGGTANENENLSSITYQTYAVSYIAGYLSALQKPNCRAISIAGFDAPFLSQYQHGFEQGVIDAGGTVSAPIFLSTGFDGFEMPNIAYEKTTPLLVNYDLVFAMSAGSNVGIINAARNYTEQRYVIGIDADQSWMGRTVVTGSVVKLFGIDIYEYISGFSQGEFQSGNYSRTMEEGKSSFLINANVLGNIEIPDNLLQNAIEKENQYNK